MNLFAARKILLCLRYGIGDVVMQTPAIETLRNNVSAFIQGLGSQPALQLLENDPRIDELINVQDFGFLHWADSGSADANSRMRKWVSSNDHDLILNVTDAVEAVRWVMWESEGAKFDANSDAIHRFIRVGMNGTIATNVATGLGWGLEVPPNLPPRLIVPTEAFSFADQFLEQQGLFDAQLIGISPVASSPLKRWPLDRMAALADRISSEIECTFLLFCGPETKIADEILRQSDMASFLVIGPWHLSRIAAALSSCTVFISNDTGLMHIAAAMGTPTVGIFGPTSPSIYLPPFEHAVAVGTSDFDCCHRKTEHIGPPGCWGSPHCLIAEDSCIDQVEVDEVYEAAVSFLANAKLQNPIDSRHENRGF